MKLGKNASLGSVVGGLSMGLRERRRRTLTVSVVFAVLIGTPVLSMTFFSIDESGTVVVEPGSYYATHFGLYGFGKLSYSFAEVSGPQIYLVELDRRNFERLADGKTYTYTGYESLNFGEGGRTDIAGIIWDEYLVLVNEESTPAEVAYEVDASSYVNLIAAGLLLAITACVAYAVWRTYPVSGERATRLPPTKEQLMIRRKALVIAAILLVTPFAVMELIGLVVPVGSHFLYGSAFAQFYIGGLIATAIAFKVKFRVRVVAGEPKLVLADLAHRLRISGFSVVEKKSMISLPISGYSATKLTAKRVPEGTLVEYQNEATPPGWTVIIVLLLFMFTMPFALVLALYGLHPSAAFAGGGVLPRSIAMPGAVPQGLGSARPLRGIMA